VEETFAIQVTDDEMVPENLDSIDSLVAYVEGKRAPGAAGAGA
jgi:acyl carrier protein